MFKRYSAIIHQNQETSSDSENNEGCNCEEGNCHCRVLKINVLKKEASALLDIIEKVDDPYIRSEIISRYKEVIDTPEPSGTKVS